MINISTGPTTRFRGHLLNDTRFARLASDLCSTWPQSEAYPARCGDAMELYLRYDGFCT